MSVVEFEVVFDSVGVLLGVGSVVVLKLMTPLATSWLYHFTFSSFETSFVLECLDELFWGGNPEQADRRCCLEHSPLVWVNAHCSFRTQGAEGNLSDLYGVDEGFDKDLFAMAAIATGDMSTVLSADLVRRREFTLAVDNVFNSPKSWSRMALNEFPGKRSSRKTARSLLLIFKSGSVAVACASWV